MVEKLKLALQSKWLKHGSQWLLFLKSAGFGAVLWLAARAPLNFFSVTLFICIAVLLYARPLLGTPYPTKYAFAALMIASLAGMSVVRGSIFVFPALIFYTAIFWALLAIKDVLVTDRPRWYFLCILALVWSAAVSFFASQLSDFFFVKFIAVVVGCFAMMREWLAFIPSFHFPRREIMASLVAALLFAELLWAAALLPFGFLAAATFVLVCFFTLSQMLLAHFIGGISRNFLIRQGALFVFLVALIFGTSKWGI